MDFPDLALCFCNRGYDLFYSECVCIANQAEDLYGQIPNFGLSEDFFTWLGDHYFGFAKIFGKIFKFLRLTG
jgi:hypothetical protein